MKRIPISAAAHIAKTYGYDQVVIIARKVGDVPAPHGEHCTTYGVNALHRAVAARIGDFLKFKVMGWIEQTRGKMKNPAPNSEKDQALIEAVLQWEADRHPNDPGDARLMQAIWRHQGDNTEPCEGCGGECGEACAPCTAAAACAKLDRYIEDYNRRHGITPVEG